MPLVVRKQFFELDFNSHFSLVYLRLFAIKNKLTSNVEST